MKKLFLVAGIVAVLALIPLSSLMATQDEAPATTDQITLVSLDDIVVGHKVAICHFDGHDGGFGDFVIIGRGIGCTGRGGCVLIVARRACEKGHKADNNLNVPNSGLCTDDIPGNLRDVNLCG